MKEALVSIIVPVYNAERYLGEMMDCVRRQTYQNWELLLVEDGSSDGSAEVVRKYIGQWEETRIRLLIQPCNMGAAKARNRALGEARGRYIAYLDADDLWEPGKLERQVAFMEETKAVFSFTGYEFADGQGKGLRKIVHVPSLMHYKSALKNTTIFTSTVMFDTAKIDKGLLEMPLIKSEDTALWWKVLRTGYTAHGLDENLVKYRRPGKSLSSNKLEALRRIWNLYRKAEGMNIISSAWNFCFWALHAVARRI